MRNHRHAQVQVDDDGELYEIDTYPEHDNPPSVEYYAPVTLEELASEDDDEDAEFSIGWAFPSTDSGDVDWERAFVAVKQWIDADLVGTWEQNAMDNWNESETLEDRANGDNLERLHQTIAGLSVYTDLREFSAWLAEAIDLLGELNKQANKRSQLVTTRRTRENLLQRISELEQEISDFENEWGFRSRLAEFEESALNYYVRCVVKAQKRVAARRAAHEGIGKFGRKPNPTAIGSSYEFEEYCAEWMLYLGAEDAEVSVATGDGGVDILSADYVAQVKMFNGPIPVGHIRDLLGTAVDFDRKPLFFASMGYSKGGIEFADRNGIALFVVNTHRGSISAANEAGAEALEHGLHG